MYISTLFCGNAKFSEHNPFKFSTKRNWTHTMGNWEFNGRLYVKFHAMVIFEI